MTLFVGQHVWTHFPGNRVRAVVCEIGAGEAKVLEDGSSKAEWVPLSWVETDDADEDGDDADALWLGGEDVRPTEQDDLLPGFGEYAQQEDED